MDATIQYFRSVFNNDAGRKIFANLLMDMGVFDDDLSTPEQIAVANYGKRLIKRIGIVTPEQIDSLVEKMFEIKVENEE